MLVFHNHCQMGNQMFIYACATSLAKKNKTSFCLSSLEDLKYFKFYAKEKRKNWLKYNLIFRITNLIKPYQKFHFQDNRIDFSSEMLFQKKKNSWFYGYFQGENYFFENSTIHEEFQILDKFVEPFKVLKTNLLGDKDYLVVHIRLRDYKTFGPDYLDGPDMTLPVHYYKQMIEKYRTKNQFIVFLSDDIEAVKLEYSEYENCYFSNHDSITDFQFILNANTIIQSCSSFAWWGSYLNKNNPIVVTPNYFLGFKVQNEYPVNIIPENWIQETVLL